MKKKFVILLVILMISTLLSYPSLAEENQKYLILMKNNYVSKVAETPQEYLRELKIFSKESQKNILSKLENQKGVEHPESLYICNGIIAELSKDEVRKLKKRNDIDEIIPDHKIMPPEPVEVDDDYIRSDKKYSDGLIMIKAPETWKEFGVFGKGAIVGHIDTGVAGNHEALKGKILKFKDFAGASHKPVDTNGHGTHTAGIIVGGNEGGTAIGVAPEAKLIVARGIAGTYVELLKSMEWMCDPDGNPKTDDFPKIVSCSFHTSFANDQKPYYRVIDNWVKLGILPVFSAGNTGSRPGSITPPKEHPGAFVVGAVDKKGKVALFSARGPVKYKHKKITKPDIAAPGKFILSAKNNGGYKRLTGTSQACPYVAGVAALLLSVNPELSGRDLRKIIQKTAKDKGSPGIDNQYGAGIVNCYKAVKMAISMKLKNPSVPLIEKYKIIKKISKLSDNVRLFKELDSSLASSIKLSSSSEIKKGLNFLNDDLFINRFPSTMRELNHLKLYMKQ